MTEETQTPSYTNLVDSFRRTFEAVNVLVGAQRELPNDHTNKWNLRTSMAASMSFVAAERRLKSIPSSPSEADLQRVFGQSLAGTLTIMNGLFSLRGEFNYSEHKVVKGCELPTREEVWQLREQIRKLAQAGSGEDLSHLACQI